MIKNEISAISTTPTIVICRIEGTDDSGENAINKAIGYLEDVFGDNINIVNATDVSDQIGNIFYKRDVEKQDKETYKEWLSKSENLETLKMHIATIFSMVPNAQDGALFSFKHVHMYTGMPYPNIKALFGLLIGCGMAVEIDEQGYKKYQIVDSDELMKKHIEFLIMKSKREIERLETLLPKESIVDEVKPTKQRKQKAKKTEGDEGAKKLRGLPTNN